MHHVCVVTLERVRCENDYYDKRVAPATVAAVKAARGPRPQYPAILSADQWPILFEPTRLGPSARAAFAHDAGRVCDCRVCGPSNRTCPHALSQWRHHDEMLVGPAHRSDSVPTPKAVVEATLTMLQAQLEAVNDELRQQVLRFVVARIVDQNLAAIKARLWRPDGRLMWRQRKRVLLEDGKEVHESGTEV